MAVTSPILVSAEMAPLRRRLRVAALVRRVSPRLAVRIVDGTPVRIRVAASRGPRFRVVASLVDGDLEWSLERG